MAANQPTSLQDISFGMVANQSKKKKSSISKKYFTSGLLNKLM